MMLTPGVANPVEVGKKLNDMPSDALGVPGVGVDVPIVRAELPMAVEEAAPYGGSPEPDGAP